MFEGEKTFVFWIGLIIVGLASIILFAITWFSALSSTTYWWKFTTPFIAGSIVFILIGLYMMKSGVKKEKEQET